MATDVYGDRETAEGNASGSAGSHIINGWCAELAQRDEKSAGKPLMSATFTPHSPCN
jgi:hypothetical protein